MNNFNEVKPAQLPYFKIFEITNLTSEFKIFKCDSNNIAEAVELDEHGVVVDLPQKACAKGQMVQVIGAINIVEKDLEFSPTAKIIEVVSGSLKRVRVSLEFHNYESKVWEAYLKCLKDRQEKFQKIFESMKG